MKAEEKYKGSLKLAVIGDALGWMTEFEKSKDSLNKKFETDYITSFHDWEKRVGGRFFGFTDKVKSGSYSVNTQLLLSVARSIIPEGLVNQQYFAKKELPNWLLYSRGAERTIKNAAKRLSEVKSAKWYDNFFTFRVGKNTINYRECGANGAAMRILPIALANFGDSNKIKKEIFKNSIITHGHPRAILGAMLYGYAINTILSTDPNNFNCKDFLTKLGKDFHQTFSIGFLDNNLELENWECEWNKKSKVPFRMLFESILNETQNYLRDVYKSMTKNVRDFDVLTKLGCYKYETKSLGLIYLSAQK
ncbi:MAG: ADP-ribosylglycohydrolase family protein [Flavobacteriaceae bacterium]|nr:ADP-ribosylglycohydrolase family protein [Flavobacteriaceae bacterium]